MLRFALCDDQPQELKIIHNLLSEYFSVNATDAQVIEFTHPDKLLAAIETESYHLYILDIVMPMVSGLELGKAIRGLDRQAQIIFVTTEPQYALQAYAASPANYLVKPVQKQSLFNTLDLAVSKIDMNEEETFAVRTGAGMRILKISDIAYCEYCNHVVLFGLIDGEKVQSRTVRENFSEYCASILKSKHFLSCHTSYIINMRRVERFDKDSFKMRGDKTVPISTKRYNSVRDTYLDYLLVKGMV